MTWDSKITFLMDNDGVLVDGDYDYLWYDIIPRELAKKRGISFKEAYDFCVEEYAKFYGTIEWYDVYFWEKRFGIKFANYIRKPKMFEDAKEFLDKYGNQTIVVTAGHPSVIGYTTADVKKYVRAIYSVFDFGLPKESPAFFHALIKKEHLIPENLIFIDDKIENVEAARKAGIKSFLLDRNAKEEKEGVINSLKELM